MNSNLVIIAAILLFGVGATTQPEGIYESDGSEAAEMGTLEIKFLAENEKIQN